MIASVSYSHLANVETLVRKVEERVQGVVWCGCAATLPCGDDGDARVKCW
jgi:hypothetical protein